MNIKEKKILIFGTGGSGKTVFAHDLWKKFKTPLAYDINGDYAKQKGGIAYNPTNIDGEIIDFIDLYYKINQKRKIDAIFFDDADAYITYETMHNPKFKDLIVRHRNKKVSLVFISKRPQNLPTWVVENYHVMFVFNMEGKNALKRLEDIDDRIIQKLESLSLYHSILKLEGKEPIIQKPVKI